MARHDVAWVVDGHRVEEVDAEIEKRHQEERLRDGREAAP
jgi:hypothetical protein